MNLEPKEFGWREFAIQFFIASLVSIPLLIVISILLSPLVTLLWNWLMPTLFGFKEISWLQGAGLFLLARLLFANK